MQIIEIRKGKSYRHSCDKAVVMELFGRNNFMTIWDEGEQYVFEDDFKYCPFCGVSMKRNDIEEKIKGITPRKLSAYESQQPMTEVTGLL